MSENTSPAERKGDKLFDAMAAVVLLSIFVGTVVFWVSSQT